MGEPTNTNYFHKLYSSLNFSSRNFFFIHSLFFFFHLIYTRLLHLFCSSFLKYQAYRSITYILAIMVFFYCFSLCLSYLFEMNKVFNSSHITLRNSLSSNEASLSKIAYFVTSALWPMITRIYLTKLCNKDYFS